MCARIARIDTARTGARVSSFSETVGMRGTPEFLQGQVLTMQLANFPPCQSEIEEVALAKGFQIPL